MSVPLWGWAAALGAVVVLLALDLLVLNRKAHEIRMREAALHSALFIACGLTFGAVLVPSLGTEAAGQYFAGYLVELGLSLDNVFVWALVFGYFGIPAKYQDRALLLGIVGAIVFRVIFLAAGIALLEALHWAIYIFGAFLLYTGIRLARGAEIEVHPDRNLVLRLLRRVMPVSSELEGHSFTTRLGGVRYATPLLGALVLIATLDVVFAVDSVPAILAVTREPFLVVTATMFAVLGLRALYFVLASALPQLPYLHHALAAILVFIGAKMLLSDVVEIPISISLGVIATILAAGVVASLVRIRRSGVTTPTSD